MATSVLLPPASAPDAADIQPYLTTLERLAELPFLEEDEDYTRPTQRALSETLRLLAQTEFVLRGTLPEAWATTTEQGGINLSWRKDDYSVQLTLASTDAGKDYLYVRVRGQSSMHRDISPQSLAARLKEWDAYSE